MAVISIFSASFVNAPACAQKVAKDMGYDFCDDRAVAEMAAARFGFSAEKFQRTMTGAVSPFNRFTREQERACAFLKSVVADLVLKDRLVLLGRCTHLITRDIDHVLFVCLAADTRFRVERAVASGLDGSQAGRAIKRDDAEAYAWSQTVHGTFPWDPALYDILIPMDSASVDDAAVLIEKNARKDVVLQTTQSLARANDLALTAAVEVALARAGHDVDVAAKDGAVTVTVNKHVLLLSRLTEELTELVRAVPGVVQVQVEVGPGFHKNDIYRKVDFTLPGKVLLVDDEKEFVQTLSDRLLMRDMGSAVVYDGEQALNFVADDEPEVMVLDLNLPGMNGVEVLRRVKQEHPGVEVIILTGHGSAKDQSVCMGLGAFAYLEKPVNIEVLAETMQRANEKARKNRNA
ncbi:MAG: response regulator [Thermodesulfobacteriota bacterium]